MRFHWSAAGQFAQFRADYHAVLFPSRQRDGMRRPAKATDIDNVRVNTRLDINCVAGFGGVNRRLNRLKRLGLGPGISVIGRRRVLLDEVIRSGQRGCRQRQDRQCNSGKSSELHRAILPVEALCRRLVSSILARLAETRRRLQSLWKQSPDP